MLLLQFYDLNLFQNKTLWLKNRKEISFPSLSLFPISSLSKALVPKPTPPPISIGGVGGGLTMSSLVQRQPERQGIFKFVTLS